MVSVRVCLCLHQESTTGLRCVCTGTGVSAVCTDFTLEHSSLQKVAVQQFIYGQIPDQVETAEPTEDLIQVSGGGSTLRQQHRHLEEYINTSSFSIKTIWISSCILGTFYTVKMSVKVMNIPS